MKLPVHLANNIFKTSWTAYDETATRIKGRAVRVQEPDRIVVGTIQPAGNKQQTMLPDGANSDGALSIFTNEALYSYDATQNAEIQRQTFVRFEGEVWKIHVVQNWQIHIQTNINKYLATKYVNVDDND